MTAPELLFGTRTSFDAKFSSVNGTSHRNHSACHLYMQGMCKIQLMAFKPALNNLAHFRKAFVSSFFTAFLAGLSWSLRLDLTRKRFPLRGAVPSGSCLELLCIWERA